LHTQTDNMINASNMKKISFKMGFNFFLKSQLLQYFRLHYRMKQ